MKKYTRKYRIKNVGELKMLLTKTTDQPTLAWQTELRPNLGNHSSWQIIKENNNLKIPLMDR